MGKVTWTVLCPEPTWSCVKLLMDVSVKYGCCVYDVFRWHTGNLLVSDECVFG